MYIVSNTLRWTSEWDLLKIVNRYALYVEAHSRLFIRCSAIADPYNLKKSYQIHLVQNMGKLARTHARTTYLRVWTSLVWSSVSWWSALVSSSLIHWLHEDWPTNCWAKLWYVLFVWYFHLWWHWSLEHIVWYYLQPFVANRQHRQFHGRWGWPSRKMYLCWYNQRKENWPIWNTILSSGDHSNSLTKRSGQNEKKEWSFVQKI